MDYRRLFLAAALSLGFLMLWQYLFPPEPPKPKPVAKAGREVGGEAAGRPAPGLGAAAEAPAEASPLPSLPVAGEAERRIIVDTGLARAELTNRGAQLVSFVLKEDRDPQGKGLEMVRARSGEPYPFALVGPDRRPLPLNEALFAVDRQRRGGEEIVTFRYSGPLGTAEKRFRFGAEGLFEVEARVPGRKGWAVVVGPGLRNPTKSDLENRFERRAAVYKTGEEVTVLEPQRQTEPTAAQGEALRWIGLEDNYFLTAIVPQEGLRRAVLLPVLVQPDGRRYEPVPANGELSSAQKELSREYLLLLEPAGDRLAIAAYWGAKEYNRLSRLPYGLQETIRLGRFGFLARPLLAGLHWIYDHVVANYGWAIILMTVLIKLLLLPLTHRSTVSMRKMQELNPKMQAIRERYRPKLKDKQGRPNLEMQRKMNEEVMALYKAEGVNPAGGCLPLLLQMPVFLAFYQLLSTAVELRNAPWMLWIRDLSAHDPFYVLPLVMGATQFVQTRMTPSGADPMQRRIFQLMPVFMTVLFLRFPSGLVLYWLTNNVLTILQQAVYNHLRTREASPAAAGAGEGRKRQAGTKAR